MLTMLLEELKTFCLETSIHGLSQIANDKTHVLKRVFWFGIFLVCLAFAGLQLNASVKGMLKIIIRNACYNPELGRI